MGIDAFRWLRRVVDVIAACAAALSLGILLAAIMTPERSVWRVMRTGLHQAAVPFVVRRMWTQLVGDPPALLRGSSAKRVVFMDYECDACIREWRGRFAEEGTVVRHLPLRSHALARSAAAVMVCAENWQQRLKLHRALLASPQEWRVDGEMMRLVMGAGVRDTALYRQCLSSDKVVGQLARDSALASALGIHGIPAVETATGVTIGSRDK
jgi:hypothetical protein